MNKTGKVLLVTGPAGSGKSTLSKRISDKLGWQNISEDEYWVNNGWGEGLRTEGQEEAVQKQVLDHMISVCEAGKSVVLEFILYKNPPNPLSTYMDGLDKASIEYNVVALRPSVDEILKRIERRGRTGDADQMEQKRGDAENQIQCLGAEYIKPEWVIDPTDISEDALAELVSKKLKDFS